MSNINKMARFRALVFAALLIFVAESAALAEEKGLDRFAAVFEKFPTNVPTSFTVDAPVTGNGDIGLTMAPSDGQIVFYVGKNDFWKAVESYPDGKIALPGGLTIKSDIIKEDGYRAEQLPGSAELKARFGNNSGTLKVKAWVPALDNKVVIDLESSSPEEISLELWALDGSKSTVAKGTEGDVSWVSRSFENIEGLLWPTHATIALNRKDGKLVLHPGEKQTLVLAIYTNHDTDNWHEKAISEASNATEASLVETLKAHREWWDGFWSLSEVGFDDAFLEKYYYQSQYILACASREGKFAPGLWGPFITSDEPGWAGDYHLNYNYQGPLWACYSSNHISLTDNYDQPLLDYMEKGRSHARNLFGCRGILYPVGLGPKGLCSSAWPKDQEGMKHYGGGPSTLEDGAMFWRQKTNASFAAANMMMRFYSTYDKEYARRIYPFVKACAEFWEDYLTFEDGRYVVKGDVFHERAPWQEYEGDFNCVVSLGMARMTFLGADALSRFLKEDRRSRSKWEHILKNLSDFPIGITEDGRKVINYREQEGWSPEWFGRIHMHGVLLPTGLTGPFSTPEYNSIMLDNMMDWKADERKDWGNSMGNGIETVYPGAARIGYPAAELLEHLRDRIIKGAYPNCYIHAGGGGIETLSAVPGTINEMMLQSYEGIIRVFPNWDRNMDGYFKDLRAYGAFLVSSSISGGNIGEVTIKSEKGRRCLIENPWPGHSVRMVRNGRAKRTLKGDSFKLRTRPGDVLTLTMDS